MTRARSCSKRAAAAIGRAPGVAVDPRRTRRPAARPARPPPVRHRAGGEPARHDVRGEARGGGGGVPREHPQRPPHRRASPPGPGGDGRVVLRLARTSARSGSSTGSGSWPARSSPWTWPPCKGSAAERPAQSLREVGRLLDGRGPPRRQRSPSSSCSRPCAGSPVSAWPSGLPDLLAAHSDHYSALVGELDVRPRGTRRGGRDGTVSESLDDAGRSFRRLLVESAQCGPGQRHRHRGVALRHQPAARRPARLRRGGHRQPGKSPAPAFAPSSSASPGTRRGCAAMR